MKYGVVLKGKMKLKTNDLQEARRKLEELGDTAFIYYGKSAIKKYETTHVPTVGESE